MRFRVSSGSSMFGGTATAFSIMAAALLGIVMTAALSSAGDLSLQPADSMSITNSATKLLPQTQAAESGLLSGLHVSGYASQTFGMWQNPSTLREWTRSRNNLATSRTLLQIDENYRLNENNTFFAREWFVYEPPYAFNSASNFVQASITNQFRSAACAANHAACPTTPQTGAPLTAPSSGHYFNELANNYSVRDFWWENKTGPLTTFVGNQIVVWGQSLAFRVGDVVNPSDISWNFGFANLEQSRNAQWMIHPILNLPEVGPFQSNFLELIVQPGFQPQWWSNGYPDCRFCGPGGDEKDGRTGTFFYHADGETRFSIHIDGTREANNGLAAAFVGPGPYGDYLAKQYYDPVHNIAHGPVTCPPNGFKPTCYLSGSPFGLPFSHTAWECGIGAAQFPLTVPFNPLRKLGLISPNACSIGLATRVPFGGFGNTQALSKGNLPTGPVGNYALFNAGPWRIPGMQPENWNDGARLHTLIGATELTVLYYNDNVNGGAPSLRYIEPYYTNEMQLYFPDLQEVGVTADRPMPVPASLGEYLPVVGRAEVLYVNHAVYQDGRPLSFSSNRYSDQVKWMAALDIDQAYAPWLTSTGNLTAFFEVYDQITMDNAKTMPVGVLIDAPNQKNQVFALASIGAGFFWEDVEPTWTMIYQPAGTTFALFPTLVLNPPWTKKYFMKLQAIEVMGSNKLQGLGLFKGESLLTAQFQYNFNLL